MNTVFYQQQNAISLARVASLVGKVSSLEPCQTPTKLSSSKINWFQMIYSAVKNNWIRLNALHRIAHIAYCKTAQSDFRNRIQNGGNPFPFNARAIDAMEEESSLVGMIIAWCATTLECIANHAIAESFENSGNAVMAIESPKRYLTNNSLGDKYGSELAKKVYILGNNLTWVDDRCKLADKISQMRNDVIHDKPALIFDTPDGDFMITEYKNRGENSGNHMFEKLESVYSDCEQIVRFIYLAVPISIFDFGDFSFLDIGKK